MRVVTGVSELGAVSLPSIYQDAQFVQKQTGKLAKLAGNWSFVLEAYRRDRSKFTPAMRERLGNAARAAMKVVDRMQDHPNKDVRDYSFTTRKHKGDKFAKLWDESLVRKTFDMAAVVAKSLDLKQFKTNDAQVLMYLRHLVSEGSATDVQTVADYERKIEAVDKETKLQRARGIAAQQKKVVPKVTYVRRGKGGKVIKETPKETAKPVPGPDWRQAVAAKEASDRLLATIPQTTLPVVSTRVKVDADKVAATDGKPGAAQTAAGGVTEDKAVLVPVATPAGAAPGASQQATVTTATTAAAVESQEIPLPDAAAEAKSDAPAEEGGGTKWWMWAVGALTGTLILIRLLRPKQD